MRPVRLTSIPLALLAATLVLASAAVAQTPTPEPCQAFNPCTRVIGPWVTAPSDLNQLFQLTCPAGTTAVSGDAAFPAAIYPVGIVTAGGLGPGGSSLEFAAFPDPRAVTFKPAGRLFASRGEAGAVGAGGGQPEACPGARAYRPGPTRRRGAGAARLPTRHAPGALRVVGRVLYPSSAAGSSGEGARASSPPRRTGDADRRRRARRGGGRRAREVQVTAVCAPASDRAAARLQGRTPQPCQTVEPCTPVVGPWVTAPRNSDSIYTVSCPDGQFAVGSDAGFPGAISPVAIETGGGLVAGRSMNSSSVCSRSRSA